MTKRLTRKQQQAHTRSCLIQAAARVFARRGLHQASIDEVTEDAGYTKGAFYANFKNKQELFLAMLDERFAERIDEVDSVLEADSDPEDQARQAGADFVRYLRADPEWQRLFFEFAAQAGRDEDFREELVTRYRSLRDRLAQGYAARLEQLGVTPPFPPEQIALMTFAMANGFALERLLEPEAASDDIYGDMLATFFAGLRSRVETTA